MFGIQTPPSQLGPKGVELISSFEGFRAEAYTDPAGHATIGFGHLIHHGSVTAADRRAWGRISRKRALELLRKDAQVAANAVRKGVKVKLTQDQFDALVSFTFNVGVGGFNTSTLRSKLNRGDKASVPAELRKWSKAGGVTMGGLLKRRIAEGKLFAGTHTAPKKKVGGWRRVYGDCDCSPELLRRLDLVAQDTGIRVYVRYGKRSRAEQTALYAAFKARGFRAPLVARPGTSRHETGLAADCQAVLKNGRMVNIGTLDSVRKAMRKRGLCLPVPGETWHVERGTTWAV